MTFTDQHGLALLALLANLDHRQQVADEASLRGKAETWAKLLRDADPQWVRGFVERAHMDPRPYPLTVGDIRRGWDNHRRVETSRHRDEDPSPIPGMPQKVWSKRPEWFDQYRRDCDAVRAQGGDVMGVPLPYLRVSVDDSRERQCGNDICLCTHRECRDGWLDVETTVTSRHGRAYQAVQRCPTCAEAVDMRSELHPKRRTRR